MSITYGFYNSQNRDRRYNAIQISRIFDGIITDGIFEAIGDKFMVSAGSGMTVNVGSGRAWFNHTWTLNDAPLQIDISEADQVLDRIDTVVLDIDCSNRLNDIVVVKGTPASNPVRPTLIQDDGVEHYQYPLCDIYIATGVTEIVQQHITNRVGIDYPFVTGVVQSVAIDGLVAQWQAQWEEWVDIKSEAFDEWLNALRVILDEDAATNLANRILELENDTVKSDEFTTYKELLDAPEMHRNIFRGKYLGNEITAEQLAAIRDGTFEDLYVGDYWTIPYREYGSSGGESWEHYYSMNWRIADINYWLNRGDTKFTTPHLVIIPDGTIDFPSFYKENNSLYRYAMCSQPIISGYYGSYFHQSAGVMASGCREQITEVFGDIILSHREYFVNDIDQTGGYPTAGAWYDSTIDLPNEIMIFGCHIFAVANYGSTDVQRHTIDNTQLALFRLHPESIMVPGREYWLRDVANINRYAFVSENGEASYGNANSGKGYRPVFAIG